MAAPLPGLLLGEQPPGERRVDRYSRLGSAVVTEMHHPKDNSLRHLRPRPSVREAFPTGATLLLCLLLLGCHSPEPGPDPAEAEHPVSRARRDDCDFRMTGWATAEGGTTGGAGGETVTVSRPEDLAKCLENPKPLTIQIKGTLDLSREFPGSKPNGRYYVRSNKTIIGLGSDAGILCGELRLSGVNNVIIRNLTFSGARDTALAITDRSTHVWIDHNNFSSAGDGLLDITGGADLITVSWNCFRDHNKVSLVGAGDDHTEDAGRLRVTYHHNWFEGTRQRHPRVRYGRVHLFNNLYENVVAGIGIGVDARIVSRGNVFVNARRPFQFHDTPEQPGYMNDTGSLFGPQQRPPPRNLRADWSPKFYYKYTVQETRDVPRIVRNGAGAGVIDTGTK